MLGIPLASLEKRITTLANKKTRLAEARGGFADEPPLPTEEANLASFDGSAPSAKKITAGRRPLSKRVIPSGHQLSLEIRPTFHENGMSGMARRAPTSSKSSEMLYGPSAPTVGQLNGIGDEKDTVREHKDDVPKRPCGLEYTVS